MTTFKQKIQSGEIKRADAMKVRLHDLHVEPGFNLRIEGDDLEASIDALAFHIYQGGQYPALEVRPRADGGVWIVDGHRRQRAIHKALEMGAPLAGSDGDVWVNVVPFTGNDADRTARIITSAEGRALSPLETAMGYKRLQAFNWDAERIAKTVGRTPQHVGQLLLLANANSDVQAMVAAGTVSAKLAVEAVREHGENAGAFLAGELNKAKASGKAKVTAGTIKGKALPAKVTAGVVSAVDAFVDTLPSQARERLAAIEFSPLPLGQQVSVPAAALLALLKAHGDVIDAREQQAAKQRDATSQAKQQDLEAA